MNRTGKETRKSRLPVIIVLCILLVCETAVCFAAVGAGCYDVRYDTGYDTSPLKLLRVEVRNREELRDQYRILDTQKLYEVCFTYENIADFTATYLRLPDFEVYMSGEKASVVHPVNHPEVYSELVFNQVVPVGKTGEIACYIALDENEPFLLIQEKNIKLYGKGESMEIWLPDQGEVSWWEAEN